MDRSFYYFSVGCACSIMLFFFSCTKMGPEKVWDNPYDPEGINWFSPLVLSSDTTVAINVPLTLNIAGCGKKKVFGYLWSFDKGKTWDTLLPPEPLTHSWGPSEAGANLVLVRAMDTAYFVSPPDSIIVNVHSFVPVIKPVNDTIVGQYDSVMENVGVFDTNSGALKYFWSTPGTADADTTDEPRFTWKQNEGGPLIVRWGVVDRDGNAVQDTFSILFNRRPSFAALTEPPAGSLVSFISYNSERGEGTVQFGFSAEDPDGAADKLSYSLFIGGEAESLSLAYSGRASTYTGGHFKATSDYYWKLRVYDLFGDSVESSGTFSTVPLSPAPDGMKLVRSRSRSFIMGRSGFDSAEAPPHTVSFSRHFWMDSTEVTAREFSAVMGFGAAASSGAALPAAHCTWYDAVLYCNARSKAQKRDTAYSYTSITGVAGNGCVLSEVRVNREADGYRLPTEAEWEYACRGGAQSTFYWGDDPSGAENCAWTTANAGGRMHPVGMKKGNAFGLYDMSGNLWEWCNDWFGADYYTQIPSLDPTGPPEGMERVIRGGGYQDDGSFAACSIRGRMRPENSSVTVGFRTVLAN